MEMKRKQIKTQTCINCDKNYKTLLFCFVKFTIIVHLLRLKQLENCVYVVKYLN